MAQTLVLWGNTYNSVPSVLLPKQGGGTASFIDETEVITYYTGSSAPSSSLGSNGDIYLQTGV